MLTTAASSIPALYLRQCTVIAMLKGRRVYGSQTTTVTALDLMRRRPPAPVERLCRGWEEDGVVDRYSRVHAEVPLALI
jgi:hypothetical protein